MLLIPLIEESHSKGVNYVGTDVPVLPVGSTVFTVVKEAINSETLDDVSSKLIAGRIPDNQDFIIDGKV